MYIYIYICLIFLDVRIRQVPRIDAKAWHARTCSLSLTHTHTNTHTHTHTHTNTPHALSLYRLSCRQVTRIDAKARAAHVHVLARVCSLSHTNTDSLQTHTLSVGLDVRHM